MTIRDLLFFASGYLLALVCFWIVIAMAHAASRRAPAPSMPELMSKSWVDKTRAS